MSDILLPDLADVRIAVGSGGRALRRRGPVLPHPEGAIGGLLPGHDAGRPAHQRRHGQGGGRPRGASVVDPVREFESLGMQVTVVDPWEAAEEVKYECGLTPVEAPDQGAYDAIVLAVGHDQFRLHRSAVDCRL